MQANIVFINGCWLLILDCRFTLGCGIILFVFGTHVNLLLPKMFSCYTKLWIDSRFLVKQTNFCHYVFTF